MEQTGKSSNTSPVQNICTDICLHLIRWERNLFWCVWSMWATILFIKEKSKNFIGTYLFIPINIDIFYMLYTLVTMNLIIFSCSLTDLALYDTRCFTYLTFTISHTEAISNVIPNLLLCSWNLYLTDGATLRGITYPRWSMWRLLLFHLGWYVIEKAVKFYLMGKDTRLRW